MVFDDSRNQFRTLHRHIVDAVLQPDCLADGQHVAGGRHGFGAEQSTGGRVRVVLLPGRHYQHGASGFWIKGRGVMVPQGFDDADMVLPAQLGPEGPVFKHFEVRQHHIYKGRSVGGSPLLDTLLESIKLHAGKVRRGHLFLGLIKALVASRGFYHAAVHEAEAAGRSWVCHRQFQCYVAAPGMAHYDGLIQVLGLNHSRDIATDRGEVITVVRLGAFAVSPEVHVNHGEATGEDGGNLVPYMTGGGQPVQQQYGLS